MVNPWKWIREDGKPLAVEISGQIFTARKYKLAEVESFGDVLDQADWVFSRLLNAVSAVERFAVPSYQGAVDKLISLRVEYRMAETVLGRAALDIGAFFEPAGAGKAFIPDSRALHDFIEEARRILPESAQDAPGTTQEPKKAPRIIPAPINLPDPPPIALLAHGNGEVQGG